MPGVIEMASTAHSMMSVDSRTISICRTIENMEHLMAPHVQYVYFSTRIVILGSYAYKQL